MSFISCGFAWFNWHFCTVASLKVPAMIVFDVTTKVVIAENTMADLNSDITFVVLLSQEKPLRRKKIHTHTYTHTHTHTQTHTHTHTFAPKVVYWICRPGFLHCNCQTVNPGKQFCINFVKQILKLHLRPLLIVEKGAFNVLIAQLIEFQTQIWAKFQNRFLGTLKLMIPGLRDKSHPVIHKNAFPRKWISKVITSDILHLSPKKFIQQCFGNMKFMKASLWNKLHATISRNTFSSKEISKVVPSSIFPSMQEVSREMRHTWSFLLLQV